MAIRFTDDYNKMIRREVSNFNRRRRNAIRAGIKNLPDKAYVSELKRRYDKRGDLNRELKLLNEFRRNTLREVEVSGGVKAIEWDLQHIKANLRQAQEFYNKEAEILTARAPQYPGERQRLDTILKNKAILQYDLDNLNQEQFDSIKGSIQGFIRTRNIMASGYRGFLSEVDEVMTTVGVPKEKKKQFFNKINSLNQEQFFYLYERSDLIKRVYDLYVDKDDEGNVILNTSKNNAGEIIDVLLDETDVLVDEAKNKA